MKPHFGTHSNGLRHSPHWKIFSKMESAQSKKSHQEPDSKKVMSTQKRKVSNSQKISAIPLPLYKTLKQFISIYQKIRQVLWSLAMIIKKKFDKGSLNLFGIIELGGDILNIIAWFKEIVS